MQKEDIKISVKRKVLKKRPKLISSNFLSRTILPFSEYCQQKMSQTAVTQNCSIFYFQCTLHGFGRLLTQTAFSILVSTNKLYDPGAVSFLKIKITPGTNISLFRIYLSTQHFLQYKVPVPLQYCRQSLYYLQVCYY